VAIAACVAVLLIGAAICHVWAPETRNVRLATVHAGATLSDVASPARNGG
jgi:hypothetical protein